MEDTASGFDGAGIVDRRLPKWRNAEITRTRWAVSLRSRSILSKQSIYGLQGYRTYRAYRLRSDYSEIEMDLRSAFEHFADQTWFDVDSAKQVVSILDSTLPELERADPNLDVVDDDLGRARRLMVWVSPPQWIDPLSEQIDARLRVSESAEAKDFQLSSPDAVDRLFRLDEAIGLLDRIETSQAINNGLQVRRLELIRNVGVIAVLLLIAFAPVLVSSASLAFWNLEGFGLGIPVEAWLTTLSIALLGAIGALLSGLLQVRNSPVTYTDYEVRGIEVGLRVLVGSAVSVTTYYLLSWQVLPVIAVTSAGTFVLVAFISGFSERYFLKLLGLDSAERAADTKRVERPDDSQA